METLEQHLNTLEGKKPGNKYALLVYRKQDEKHQVVLYENESSRGWG